MARYQPDHRGFAEIMVGPEMTTLVQDYAHRAMGYAKAISPEGERRRSGPHTPYRDQFKVTNARTENLTREYHTLRQCVDLANVARYAEAVELGWEAQGVARGGKAHEGYHVLEQTLNYIGHPRIPRAEFFA
jgi:hypothetical protein